MINHYSTKVAQYDLNFRKSAAIKIFCVIFKEYFFKEIWMFSDSLGGGGGERAVNSSSDNSSSTTIGFYLTIRRLAIPKHQHRYFRSRGWLVPYPLLVTAWGFIY